MCSSMRNVEVKAKINDLANAVIMAEKLSQSTGTIILQNDTFYNVPQGRMKLRKFESGDAELIYYERPDVEGPKTSRYEKCSVVSGQVEGLNKVLSQALDVSGVVNKTRHVYLVGPTRIHIDRVDGLGNFIELEVALTPDQNPEEGEQIAQNLMKKLGIDSTDLLAGAYRDMLSS